MFRPLLPVATVIVACACSTSRSHSVSPDASGSPPYHQADADTITAEEGGNDLATDDASVDPHADAMHSDATSEDAGDDRAAEGKDSGVKDASDATDDATMGHPFAVLSLNLHCLKLEGTLFSSHEARWNAIADLIVRENVEIVAIQEACTTDRLDAMAALRQTLQQSTGEAWQSAWTPAHKAWEGTVDEAMEGVGLLSRPPLTNIHTYAFATQGALHRVAIGANVQLGTELFHVVSTHLDHQSEEVRVGQARELASLTLSLADPTLNVVVAGDFNAMAGSNSLGGITQYGFLDASGSLDPKRIDHVFVHRGAACAPVESKLVFDGVDTPKVSDHPGVLVKMSRRPPPQVTTTRIRIRYTDVSSHSTLWVRGNKLPFSWSRGWRAVATSQGFLLVTTELTGGEPFEFKALRNDTTWQNGNNERGTGGSDHNVAPDFE